MKQIGTTALIVLTMSLAIRAQSPAWQLDPAHSTAQFAVRHLGISTVRGNFTKVSGTVRYDPADPKNDSVDVSIDVASVDTRVEMRDNDLRSDHFFDVQKFPTITFKSTKVDSAGAGKLKVTGDLTIRGTTKQVTLDVEGPSQPINDGNGRLHMGASATTTIERADFGVSGAPGIVGPTVTLTIDVELVQPAGPSSK